MKTLLLHRRSADPWKPWGMINLHCRPRTQPQQVQPTCRFT